MNTYILKIPVAFICFLFSLKVSAQCDISKRQIYDSDFMYEGFKSRFMYKSPSYIFAPNGDTSKNWNIVGKPIELKQMPDFALLKRMVDDSIKNYSGKQFFSDITFEHVEIVYPERLEYFRAHGRTDITQLYTAKYWFTYKLTVDSLSHLYVGIGLDANKKIIARFNMPKPNTYTRIKRNVNYCKLWDIAKKAQHNNYPLKSIVFRFNNRKSEFYWQVTQDLVNSPTDVPSYNIPVTNINAGDFSQVELTHTTITISDYLPVVVKPRTDTLKEKP